MTKAGANWREVWGGAVLRGLLAIALLVASLVWAVGQGDHASSRAHSAGIKFVSEQIVDVQGELSTPGDIESLHQHCVCAGWTFVAASPNNEILIVEPGAVNHQALVRALTSREPEPLNRPPLG